MSFFEESDSEASEHKEFREGDVFYTETDSKYHIHKLLKIEDETNTFHVKIFTETTQIPTPNELQNLRVEVLHAPIARNGFNGPKLITNQPVTESDLEGYFSYIKLTQNVGEIAKYARWFYQQAHELTDQNEHEAAIKKYTSAIDLVPSLHEAIDNRAFCYMDIGKWDEAIVGFEESLTVNPDSFLAFFSIGECHYNARRFREAKPYFERANQVDPNHPKSKEFLDSINKLLNG